MAIRVGIDLTAIPENPAGAGRYIIEIANRLQSDEAFRYMAAVRGGDQRWAKNLELIGQSPSPRPLRLAWEQTVLPMLVARSKIDVFHSPHYTMPLVSRTKSVVTVHDMTFFTHPELHEKKKVSFFRNSIRFAAKHADGIICVSETTKSDLFDFFDIKGMCEVIPHGVDTNTFHPNTNPSDTANVSRYTTRPYLLFVGTLEPRKGIDKLIEAFESYSHKYPEVDLLLAGQWGWHAELIKDSISASVVSSKIKPIGYVPDAALAALYRGADMVVYPSVYEGFGLPVLEAMACGSRVVTSDVSAHAAFSSSSAYQFEAGSAPALFEAMVSAHDDRSFEDRQSRGVEAALGHSWGTSAARHQEFYARVADGE